MFSHFQTPKFIFYPCKHPRIRKVACLPATTITPPLADWKSVCTPPTSKSAPSLFTLDSFGQHTIFLGWQYDCLPIFIRQPWQYIRIHKKNVHNLDQNLKAFVLFDAVYIFVSLINLFSSLNKWSNLLRQYKKAETTIPTLIRKCGISMIAMTNPNTPVRSFHKTFDSDFWVRESMFP